MFAAGRLPGLTVMTHHDTGVNSCRCLARWLWENCRVLSVCAPPQMHRRIALDGGDNDAEQRLRAHDVMCITTRHEAAFGFDARRVLGRAREHLFLPRRRWALFHMPSKGIRGFSLLCCIPPRTSKFAVTFHLYKQTPTLISTERTDKMPLATIRRTRAVDVALAGVGAGLSYMGVDSADALCFIL